MTERTRFDIICAGAQQRTQSGPITPTLMNGGTLYVSNGMRTAFYTEYANDIEKGRRLYVCERPSAPHFPFYLDFDNVQEENFTSVKLRDGFFGSIVEFISSHLVDPSYDVGYALLTQRRTLIHEETKLASMGFHVHFPRLHVTYAEALALRREIVSFIKRSYPHYGGTNWDKVIDEGVFKNGLRLLYSRKMLRGEDIGRSYSIVSYFLASGASIDIPARYDNRFMAVVACSVYIGEIEARPVKLQIEVIEPTAPISAAAAVTILDNATAYEESGNGSLYSSVATILRREYPNFGRSAVSKLYKIGDSDKAIGIRTTCHYCENKRGAHKTNTVYFVISMRDMKKYYLTQYCFCTCAPLNPTDVACRDYRNEKEIKLSDHHSKMLFGNAKREAPIPQDIPYFRPHMIRPNIDNSAVRKDFSGTLSELRKKLKLEPR